MIRSLDHLGIAVPSLERAIPAFERLLGKACDHIEEVPSQKVRAAFFKVGEVNLELLEPTAPDSPLAKFLERNPDGGIHHMALGSDAVRADLAAAAAAGVRLIHTEPVPGAHGKEVAFLHPKSTCGVLTEYCGPAPEVH